LRAGSLVSVDDSCGRGKYALALSDWPLAIGGSIAADKKTTQPIHLDSEVMGK
jgi:hypothetical protein